MTKTKRILTALLMAILSVMVAFTMVACGGGEDNDNGGNNSGDNGGNNGGNGGGNSQIVYTVTEAQFNTAKDYATYTAFKAVGENTLKVNGVVDPNQSASFTYVVNETGYSISMAGSESYFEKTSDGYYGYQKVNDEWMKVPVNQNLYDNNKAMILENASPASMIESYGLILSALTFNQTEKCYVFAPAGQNGISATIKIFFENGKLVKLIMVATNAPIQEEMTAVMNYSYAAADVAITYPSVDGDEGDTPVNPNPGQGGSGSGPQDCQLIEKTYFDENQIFPKTYECSCGDASHNVTKTHIEVTTANEFCSLATMMSEQANIGTLKVEIKNDIDLGGAPIPALTAYDYQNRGRAFTFIGAAGGVTISNFTIVGEGALGLFGLVSSDLLIQNINIDNMTINGNVDDIAGGFIGVYYPCDDEGGNDIKIIDCSITNSTISAGCVGGIYGAVESELSDVRNIWIEGVKIANNTLSGAVAGGIMGTAAYSLDKEVVDLSINSYILIGNTITSGEDNQAGLFVGVIGTAKIFFSYPTTGNEDKINNNTVTANGTAITTREYGRTGWTSEADATYVWVSTSPMFSYATAIH